MRTSAFQVEGDTGHETGELMALYREIQATAGMDALYAIEERTTEKPGAV